MKTKTQYEETFSKAVTANEFICVALNNGWSLEAILGVFLERNETMLNKVIELELIIRSLTKPL